MSDDGRRGQSMAQESKVNVGRVRGLFALLLMAGVAVVAGVVLTQSSEAPMPDEADGLPDVGSSGPEGGIAASRPVVNLSALTISEMPQSKPVEVAIPSIDVISDLHEVGLNDDNTLEVPSGPRYDEAAWYGGSPTPGEVGPSVVLGHVTNTGAVPSVFFELGAVDIGDVVEVKRADGSTAEFEVYAVDTFPKDDFPTEAVYGNTEAPELRVITCGGEYDADARAHDDNVVVFAQLIDATE